MDKLRGSKKVAFVALAALAIVLAVNAPSQAQGMGGRGSGGGHAGGVVEQHGFDGHRGFDGRHFDRGVRGRFGFEFEPDLPDETPVYYWYCPSYGAYYPNVASCPETWVQVPAS